VMIIPLARALDVAAINFASLGTSRSSRESNQGGSIGARVPRGAAHPSQDGKQVVAQERLGLPLRGAPLAPDAARSVAVARSQHRGLARRSRFVGHRASREPLQETQALELSRQRNSRVAKQTVKGLNRRPSRCCRSVPQPVPQDLTSIKASLKYLI
jgi:hypothetical protein